VLEATPDGVAASADRTWVDQRTGATASIDHSDLHGDLSHRIFLLPYPPAPSHTVVRASAWRDAGGPMRRFAFGWGEDTLLFHHLSKHGPWLHVPGAPVTYRGHVDARAGEAVQVTDPSVSLEDRLAFTRCLDAITREEGPGSPLRGRAWRRELGRRWHQLGKDLWYRGRADEAARCFAAAVRIDRGHHQAMRRWIRARMSLAVARTLGRGR